MGKKNKVKSKSTIDKNPLSVLDELKFLKKNKKIEKEKTKKQEKSLDASEEDQPKTKLPAFFKAVQAKANLKKKDS